MRIRRREEGPPPRGWAYFTYPARLLTFIRRLKRNFLLDISFFLKQNQLNLGAQYRFQAMHRCLKTARVLVRKKQLIKG